MRFTLHLWLCHRSVNIVGIHHHHGFTVSFSPGKIDQRPRNVFEARVLLMIDHRPHGRFFKDPEDAFPLPGKDGGVLAAVFAGSDADNRHLLDQDAVRSEGTKKRD